MTNKLKEICIYIYKLQPNISNLRLQKILYFIQASSLYYLKKSAFNDVIEAWRYGATIPSVYYAYKDNTNIFTVSENYNVQIDKNLQDLIYNVINNFVNLQTFDLVDLICSYSSWIDTYNEDYNSIISNDRIIKCHLNIAKEKNGYIF